MPQKKGYRKGKKVPNAVKSYVDRAISRNVETKKITYDSNLTSFNNTISGAGDLLNIYPTISQGDTSYQRQGKSIKIKKLVIRGHLLWEGTGSTGLQKIGVRQMIIKSKRSPNREASNVANDLPYLLEAGGGSYQSFNGEVGDLHSPIYKSYFAAARDRKLYMYQQGASADDLSRSVKFFTIDLKQARNKVVHYNTESGSPINFGWWMALGWVALDGTMAATSVTNLKCEYVVEMTYEDA